MEEQVDKLGGVMREVAAAQRATLAQRNVLAQVRMRPPARRSAPGRWAVRLSRPRFAIPALTALGAVAVWWGLGGPGRNQVPLSFAVADVGADAGKPGAAGDRLEAPADRALTLRFSDGSRVTLAGGARVQVAELERRGATVNLEAGRANVDVRHQAHTRWRLRAGTFEVTVTGTKFDIAWDVPRQALTVIMAEGTVEVRGPALGGGAPVVVSAGQRFRATTGQTRWTLDAANTPTPALPSESAVDRAAEPTGGSPAEAPSEAPAEGAAVRATGAADKSAAPGTSRTAPGGWQALARAGRYQEALKVVERSGFDRACRRLGSEDLVQLGDAARLARNPARAEAAYRAARTRFPGSDRPAFALGLVAFDQRRDFKAAAHWFGTYGRQYPRGPLALEAAGREMESWHRAGDSARARRAARAYLDQAPAGPYAPLARQIAEP